METHFCDRDRRRSQKIEPCSIFCDLLRSFAILRSYGNQSSAICDRNVSHNNFNSDSNDSTSMNVRLCSLLFCQKHEVLSAVFGKPQVFVTSLIFFELKTDVSFAFEADDAVASGLKEEKNLLAAKFPPRCPLCCLLRFCREHNARVHLTFLQTEMYGCSRLCDRLRSSAIIWKQLSLRSSAICDPRSSAIVCDK